MASRVPTEVAAIFLTIDTDNASIIGDLLDVALAMPVGIAKSLVPSVCRAAKDGTLWIHFKEASAFCIQLAEGGESDLAMKLAEALFTPTFERDREPLNNRDEYWYKKGLNAVVPALVDINAPELLLMLCSWLERSVRRKTQADSGSGYDGSVFWRPAIEDHEQNHDHDFAGAMVGFVRKGFEEAISSGQVSLEDAVRTIDPYPYLIFKRIRLHLIGEFADKNPALARRTMLSREYVDDAGVKHEYAMLVGRRLDPEQALPVH